MDPVELAALFVGTDGGFADAFWVLEEVVQFLLRRIGVGFVVTEESLVDEGVQFAADVVGLTGEPCGKFADCPALGFEFEPGLVDEGKKEELEALEVELEEHPAFDLECAELAGERELGSNGVLFLFLFGHVLMIFRVVLCQKSDVFWQEMYERCMLDVSKGDALNLILKFKSAFRLSL